MARLGTAHQVSDVIFFALGGGEGFVAVRTHVGWVGGL